MDVFSIYSIKSILSLQFPGPGDTVTIDTAVLLDVTDVTVTQIHIIGEGSLVVLDKKKEQDRVVTITADGILIKVNITKTCPCNEDPLTPHFYIVKLGCTGVYIFFLIFALKHRLWVLIRTASMRRFQCVPTINVLSKIKKKI